jgi:hypothetical protein
MKWFKAYKNKKINQVSLLWHRSCCINRLD